MVRRKPGEMRGLGIKGKEEVGFTGGRENKTLMSTTKMPRLSPGKQKRQKRTGETFESTKTMDPEKENNRFSRKDQQTLIRAHPIICSHQYLQFQSKYYGFV